MEDCLFCKIIAGSIPAETVYEDEHFLAFLDIKPINLGHTLIVPKEHHRNIFDMRDSEAQLLGPVIQKIARAVKEGTHADGLNVGWNNESAAGQLIFHCHLHIMPRFNNDGHESWKGIENIPAEELQKTASSIRAVLQ